MCISPLDGWYSRERTPRGKRAVVFDIHEGFHDRPVTVPCGRCVECRLEHSRQWAMRCVHESSLYDENCFVTLTYDNKNLPENASLRKRDLQLFMKRLRKKFRKKKIRFFAAGEYGENFGRPHYHIILFGFDFPDKVRWSTRGDFEVWRSNSLEEVWKKGNSEIGSVTFESAAYVARYVMKKDMFSDPALDKFFNKNGIWEPVFATMSRGGSEKGEKNLGGIGKRWYERYKDEVFRDDSVIVNGVEVKPPKYYDGLYEIDDREEMEKVKRRRKARCDSDSERTARLWARKKIAERKYELFAER